MTNIKRFGDYPVGTVLEVRLNPREATTCRVETTDKDYKHACEDCMLSTFERSRCMMFDCVTNDGTHKILKQIEL